jgi:hypothetical protein
MSLDTANRLLFDLTGDDISRVLDMHDEGLSADEIEARTHYTPRQIAAALHVPELV